ncbi:MAG: ABC transporter ATP-binding protein [Desulfurococcales archaeon]|nr:ABC transporter ATP-binding protein [Desulfurococcales archaeon]
MPPIKVALEQCNVFYGSLQVLDELTLNVKEGEFVAIVGPSGCGKTTLLNLIAGILEKATINCRKREVKASKVGYATQEDLLLPWRTVWGNILLPLELLRVKPDTSYLKRLLSISGLADFIDYRPHQLSGGMRKRVVLLRALSLKPDLLLLDEPFANIDAYTKIQLQRLLMKLLSNLRTTTILVTHDIEEAVSLSNRIVILSRRPARVVKAIEVEAPWPRDPLEARRELKDYINEVYGYVFNK